MEPYIGQIIMFAGNFAMRGWALCNGQLMSIAQNTALFSILGTTYGGDGVTTFALPDLRGRVPVHPGQGPGLSQYDLGQVGGTEDVTLTISNMPMHNHLLGVHSGSADQTGGAGNVLSGNEQMANYSNQAVDTTANPAVITPSGGSQPHTNVQPYLAVNYLIALEGIYPSRQ